MYNILFADLISPHIGTNFYMALLALPIIFGIAFFVYAATGFGGGLVAMPLITPLIGIGMASPLFALVSLTSEGFMLFRNRRQLRLQSVWKLSLASMIAIPPGIALARALPEHTVLLILGTIVSGYALYSLIHPHIPQITNTNWGFGFGALAGLLSGAYNTSGPPLVIYANLRRWTPSEFKTNLQSIFILNSLVVVSIHALNGHFTEPLLENYVLVVPAMLLGLFIGWKMEKRIHPDQFRKLVLILLVFVGLRLILTNLFV